LNQLKQKLFLKTIYSKNRLINQSKRLSKSKPKISTFWSNLVKYKLYTNLQNLRSKHWPDYMMKIKCWGKKFMNFSSKYQISMQSFPNWNQKETIWLYKSETLQLTIKIKSINLKNWAYWKMGKRILKVGYKNKLKKELLLKEKIKI